MNGGSVVGRVIIGTDPHKRSARFEVRDEREILLATGRFGMDKTGYRQLLRYARRWPQRTWAVEGANGTGRPRQPASLDPVARRVDPSVEFLRNLPLEPGSVDGGGRRRERGLALPGRRSPSHRDRSRPRAQGMA